MAEFHAKTFQKHDDYMTPRHAWEDIQQFLPKDKIIWEAFYGDGQSGQHLRELGFQVIHEEIDFFTHDRGDIIVSNPPFSKSKEVLTRLKKLGKPFVLILPSSKINTQYTRSLFRTDPNPLQIIIPRKRIHFLKQINGVVPEGWRNACYFDCFYYCWKINLPRDIVWLEE
jgi:hypothetical protein